MKRLLILVVAILSLAHQVRSQFPKRYHDVVGPAKSLRQETAQLTTGDLARIEATISPSVIAGTRYDQNQMRVLDSEKQ